MAVKLPKTELLPAVPAADALALAAAPAPTVTVIGDPGVTT
jgi:hypothetical protein